MPKPSVSETAVLDAGDLAYHRHILKQLDAAQIAARSWSAYLTEKYALTAGQVVDANGQISNGVTR